MSLRIRRKKLVNKIRLQSLFNMHTNMLQYISCFTMTIACCFFTHNITVKVTSLVIMIIFGIKAFFRPMSKDVIVSFLIGVMFPLLLIIISWFDSGNLEMAVSGAYCGIFFLSLPVIFYYKIPFEKVYEKVMRVVILIVLISVILDSFGLMNIFSNPLLLFMYENKELAVATKGMQYITFYKIYLQADALLIIYACYCFSEKEHLWVILCGLTMWFSGSMANFIAFAICIFAMWFERIGKVKLSKAFVILGGGIMIAYTIIPFFIFSADMVIRASALQSYVDIISKHPLTLFFGQGYGTEIFVDARNATSMSTEWSFFEMIRWYGVVGFVFFIAIILYPLKYLIRTKKNWVVYATVGFLTIAFTNPLLYTTTGMLVYIMLYYEYFMSCKHNRVSQVRIISS